MLYYSPIKFRQYSWFLFALFLGISGCSVQEDVTNLPVTPRFTNTPVWVGTGGGGGDTSIDVSSPVLATIASPAPSPNIYTPPTHSPILPTQMPTPIATLSVNQEGALLNLLMTTNGGCDLPCWWGVIPGKTSEQEARDIFALQGLDDWVRSFDSPTYARIGLGYPRIDNPNRFHDTIITFWTEGELVYFIGVEGGYRHENIRSTFVQDWQSYSPVAMLAYYEVPPYIEFAEIKNSPYYRLTLSYNDLGVEIVYIIPFELLDNGDIKVCFGLENIDYISLALYSPGQVGKTPIDTVPDRLDNYISWESTTGSTIRDFQQLFSDPSHLPCIIVN